MAQPIERVPCPSLSYVYVRVCPLQDGTEIKALLPNIIGLIFIGHWAVTFRLRSLETASVITTPQMVRKCVLPPLQGFVGLFSSSSSPEIVQLTCPDNVGHGCISCRWMSKFGSCCPHCTVPVAMVRAFLLLLLAACMLLPACD